MYEDELFASFYNEGQRRGARTPFSLDSFLVVDSMPDLCSCVSSGRKKWQESDSMEKDGGRGDEGSQ